MRLWTLHPRHLDGRGLVALWRESLLAQKVLAGATRGYRQHPQLARFRALSDPLAGIASYLAEVQLEATRRGYAFDAGKIAPPRLSGQIDASDGQLRFEFSHLLNKLATRGPAQYRELQGLALPDSHPLFRIVPGGVADWERP